MDLEQLAKLLEVATSLLSTLCWPIVVLIALVYFGSPIKKFLSDTAELSLKAGASGFEATAKRQQIEAAALLGVASTKTATTDKDKSISGEERAREIADVVSRAARPTIIRKLATATILWVDDMPSNNFYERKALEALGIRFTLSPSTADALEKVRLNKYDAIISDMGRPEGDRAGYELLEELREIHDTSPFIIYSSSNLPEHKVEARRRGAFGTTNNPQELFGLVLGALRDHG
ncbi:response regulator [Candidatus Microgenomates bacterium]|nr:response regulator [Candidatus Microgenomates bacterium]